MDWLDEIKARFDAEPDWGVYDGALCRQDLAAILDEFSALRADLARVTAEKEAAKVPESVERAVESVKEAVSYGHNEGQEMLEAGSDLWRAWDAWRGPCVENGGTP